MQYHDVSKTPGRFKTVFLDPLKIVHETFTYKPTAEEKAKLSAEEQLLWGNRPFYTGSRAVCYHLKSSGRSRSLDSAKPVVRRESRRNSINHITWTDMHSRNSRRSS